MLTMPGSVPVFLPLGFGLAGCFSSFHLVSCGLSRGRVLFCFAAGQGGGGVGMAGGEGGWSV